MINVRTYLVLSKDKYEKQIHKTTNITMTGNAYSLNIKSNTLHR